MRILLSEGSGLTSRQVAGQLGSLGHEVEILSSSKICLTRFTRHVRAVHDVPRFGLDPFGWLAAAERIAGERRTDLLFPTQEQVTVLSARRKHLRVATVVPPFASLARVQDKISAFRTLNAIGAPQPQTFDPDTAPPDPPPPPALEHPGPMEPPSMAHNGPPVGMQGGPDSE